MRPTSLILLVISVVLGLFAVAWMRDLNKTAAVQQGIDGPSIVVAKTAFRFGDRIGADQLELVRWPQTTAPNGAFAKIEDVAGSGQERVALRDIEQGEPVLANKVSGTGARASLSTVIGPTMRAVTVRVNDQTGVAGFVLPGDRVDIMLTHDAAKESAQTDLLLQNVKVLAIDQEANEKNEKPTVVKAVTVEVTPEDAQKLVLGTAVGTLSLTLRNIATGGQIDHRALSLQDLAPGAAPLNIPAALREPPSMQSTQPRGHVVEIVRGTASTTYQVQPSGRVSVPRAPAANAPAANAPGANGPAANARTLSNVAARN